MRIDTKYYKLGGLLLVLATMSAAQRQNSPAGYAAAHKAAQLTRTHVVDQVEPLCRALFPDQDVLRFLVSPAPAYHKNNRRDTLWMADCLDTDSHVIARILWNTETKRALQFGPTLYYTLRRNRQGHSALSPVNEKVNEKVDAKMAVAIAREWAGRLRPVSHEAVLRSAYRTECVEHIWRVRLHLPDGLVMVWIHAQSGELQNAIVQDASAFRHSYFSASRP